MPQKKKRSKRYLELTNHVERKKIYTLPDAIKVARQTATTKFDSSIEIHVRLGLDTKKSEQQVRGTVVLPHGTGKTKKIAAFVGTAKEKDAKEAGADIVGGDELISSIKSSGKIDFDIALATPDMMPKLAAIAKILGPKGLMPSPKNETISVDLKKTIAELKKGKVNFKSDDTANVHQIIGKSSFSEQQLVQNAEAFMETLKKSKPASSKGTFVKNVSISSSMGPGVRVAI